MLKKDHLEMLNNLEQGGEPTKPGQHERVIFIDGLNLFLRNFAVLNFVNPSAAHIGGLAGFLRSLGALINKIQPMLADKQIFSIGSLHNLSHQEFQRKFDLMQQNVLFHNS